MSTPFLGEIKMISFNFPPRGWAFANGQLLSLAQNQALFSLYGTTYGGDGRTNFGLPNLEGRSAMHFGTSTASGSYVLGQVGGEAVHTLTVNEMPSHTHPANISTGGGTHAPGNTVLPGSTEQFYDPTHTPNGYMAPGTIGNTGGNQSHENRMPYLVINFIVAIVGIFPTRN